MRSDIREAFDRACSDLCRLGSTERAIAAALLVLIDAIDSLTAEVRIAGQNFLDGRNE